MSLAIDSQESGATGHNSATSPLSWTFLNTAGTTLLVYVGVSGISGPANSAAVSSVTYNGVSLSAIGSGIRWDNGNNKGQWFSLTSPATGSHTVSVTWSNTGAVNIDALAGAISFTGEDGVTPLGSEFTAKEDSGGTTPATVTVTGTTAGNIVVGAANAGTSFNATPNHGTKSWLLNASGNSGGDNNAGFTQAAGGSITMDWALGGADFWGIVALEVKASSGGGGGTTVKNLATLGIG